jgi:hypothetical protein
MFNVSFSYLHIRMVIKHWFKPLKPDGDRVLRYFPVVVYRLYDRSGHALHGCNLKANGSSRLDV